MKDLMVIIVILILLYWYYNRDKKEGFSANSNPIDSELNLLAYIGAHGPDAQVKNRNGMRLSDLYKEELAKQYGALISRTDTAIQADGAFDELFDVVRREFRQHGNMPLNKTNLDAFVARLRTDKDVTELREELIEYHDGTTDAYGEAEDDDTPAVPPSNEIIVDRTQQTFLSRVHDKSWYRTSNGIIVGIPDGM